MADLTIRDIYEQSFIKNNFSYIGTLRNERKFDIHQNVFFSPSRYEGTIFRGIIIGVELIPEDNPEYRYKIAIPETIAKNKDYSNKTFENVDCSSIFDSIEQAKQSAISNLEHSYKIQKESIEHYFNQYK